MKTVAKITTSLMMVLFLTVQAYPFTGFNLGIQPVPTVSAVRYIVTVSYTQEESICGHYLVIVVDASGKLVAPAQSYVPGVSNYTFYEPGRDFTGIRTARLIQAPEVMYVCEQQLFTPPQSMIAFFRTGETYYFHLFPANRPPHD